MTDKQLVRPPDWAAPLWQNLWMCEVVGMYIMFTGVVGGVEEVMMKFTQVLFGLHLQVDKWQQIIVNWWLFDDIDNIWLVRSHQILQLHLNVCAVVVVVVLIVMGRVNMTLV